MIIHEAKIATLISILFKNRMQLLLHMNMDELPKGYRVDKDKVNFDKDNRIHKFVNYAHAYICNYFNTINDHDNVSYEKLSNEYTQLAQTLTVHFSFYFEDMGFTLDFDGCECITITDVHLAWEEVFSSALDKKTKVILGSVMEIAVCLNYLE